MFHGISSSCEFRTGSHGGNYGRTCHTICPTAGQPASEWHVKQVLPCPHHTKITYTMSFSHCCIFIKPAIYLKLLIRWTLILGLDTCHMLPDCPREPDFIIILPWAKPSPCHNIGSINYGSTSEFPLRLLANTTRNHPGHKQYDIWRHGRPTSGTVTALHFTLLPRSIKSWSMRIVFRTATEYKTNTKPSFQV